MKTIRWGALGAALAAAFALSGAHAESTYGYASSGAGTVTATARINLSVSVPKMILLRVGSANTTVDTLNWSVTQTIPAGAVAPAVGNNTAVAWDGNAPTTALASSTQTTTATAWTNAAAGTVNCAATAVAPAGGPTLADFGVAASATGSPLSHPGATLNACASTAFTSNQVRSSTWTYTLGGTPTTWPAGTYTSTVTYTASGV
jgi:hypothetical protein